tara:strand:+ start:61 stop:516 length:456 start_codon:yes stop_codon:yes gene_type:complete
MAIARGAGTEIIRAHHLSCDSTARIGIYGVRHHIYTVLSCICYADALGSAGDWVEMYLTCYNSGAGTPQGIRTIFKQEMQIDQTFVWNDKFSFNGYEPVDFTGPVDSEAKQDAIADQLVSGDSNRQILYFDTQSASDGIDIFLTYIDQNNS